MSRFILALIQLYRRIIYRKYGWFGNFDNWQKAQQKCTGYDSPAILKKIRESTLKVKKGEAVYERDGLLSEKIEYSWPLLANLLWIASQKQNKLTLFDWGGSLGTSYFQNRKYLHHLNKLQWCVTEQKDFADIGKKEIADDKLRFYYSIDEAIEEQGAPDLLLISCVLPYLEKPHELLKNISGRNFPYIIIDNTYFNPEPGDRLTIQRVSPDYYEASYPAWFLDYDKIKEVLTEKYEILEEYTNEQFLYLDGKKINYRGFVAKLK